MELDDLRTVWAAQDRRLDEALRLNRRLLTLELDKARSAMQRLRWMLGIELAVGGVILLALGSFIVAHLSEPRFSVPALLMHLVVAGVCGSAGWQWVKAGEIHYDAPVAEIQRRLEGLRVVRIRTTQGVLLCGPLLWTLFVIVCLRGLGVDAYELLGMRYLLANLGFGIAFVLAVVWVCRRFADRLERATWVRSLARDVAGRNLTAALDQLARIAAFEREPTGS